MAVHITVTPDDRDLIARTALGESDDPNVQQQIIGDLVDSGESPLARGKYKSWDNPRKLMGIDAESEPYQRVAQMVDNATSDSASVLRAYGVKAPQINLPYSPVKPPGQSQTDEDILKQYGVDPTVIKKQPVPETAPAPGQFTKPTPEAQQLSERMGAQQAVLEGMPLVGPAVRAGAAATVAGIPPYPPETTYGERFKRYYDITEEANRLYAQQHPAAALGSNLLGGALTFPAAAEMTPGRLVMGLPTQYTPTMGGQFYSGMLGGGMLGSLDAFSRGQDPYTGAFIGAGAGAVAPIVGLAGRTGANTLSNYFMRQPDALSGINPVGRSFLLDAARGGSTDVIGPASFYGEQNPAFTRLAQGISFAAEPASDIIRGAYGQRAQQAFGRIQGYLDQAFGPRTNILQYERFLEEARAAAADPLYNQWRNMQVQPTQALTDMIPRLEEAGAFTRADRLSGISHGQPLDRGNMTPQSWDYVKQGLDSAINIAYREGDNTMARHLVQLRANLIDEIQNTPAGQVWRQARQEFASRSNLIDQIGYGRDTFIGGRSGTSVAELRDELQHVSQPELMARIQGARDAVSEAMGDSLRGSTTMRDKLLAPNNQEKLRLLLGDRQANGLIHNLESERTIAAKTQTVAQGTQTASNIEAVQALRPGKLPQWNPKPLEPLTWIPPHILEALRPSALVQGARDQAYLTAREQLAPLLVQRQGPGWTALDTALAAEQARRARFGRYGEAAGNLLNILGIQPGAQTLRLRGYEPPGPPSILRSAQ